MENTEPKFCKNCKFFKEQALLDHCENPIFPKQLNLITGEFEPNFCSYLRMKHELFEYSYGLCGPEARYYEKRLSWREKLWKK